MIYREERTLSSYDLRIACIAHDWYTTGDDEDYEALLDYAESLDNVTTEDLYALAKDIEKHSDTEYEIADIMEALILKCVTRVVVD